MSASVRRRASVIAALVVLPTLVALPACAAVSPEQARMAFLRDILARDNAIWMSRDTTLLAGKYRKMAGDPFDFVRGTAALYYADVAEPDPTRAQTAFLTVPEAGGVLLAGDPHVENFDTTLPGVEPALSSADAAPVTTDLNIEVVDLDGASFGPYLLDVRRGALGLAAMTSELDGCDQACADEVIAAYSAGYVDEIGHIAAGSPSSTACPATGDGLDGTIVDDLCKTAVKDGTEAAVLGSVTGALAGDEHFVLDATIDADGKGVLAVTPVESDQLDRLLGLYRANGRLPADFRELDRARRFGAGVASFPSIRYVVLWDHGLGGPEDDHLMSLREVVDPPAPPGRGPTVPVLFDSNAHRIEQVAWLLWSRPDADADMAGLDDGGTTFKATTWSGWFSGFNHADIAAGWAAGDYVQVDVDGLGDRLGRTLAGSHARGLTDEGTPAIAPIADDIAEGGATAFVDERVRDAEVDAARSSADFSLFNDALSAYGPLLGADTPTDDTTR